MSRAMALILRISLAPTVPYAVDIVHTRHRKYPLVILSIGTIV